MGQLDSSYGIRNCETFIYRTLQDLGSKYKIPETVVDETAEDIVNYVESEVEDMECDCSLSDYDPCELAEHVKEYGFVCLEALSLREMEKVEAFLEKMRENPYGKMIII